MKLSKLLREYFSDDVCHCNTSVIIPDETQELVRLAITLLDGVVGSEVELSTDLLETVPAVYSLLQIPCVTHTVEVFLNPESGNIEECYN